MRNRIRLLFSLLGLALSLPAGPSFSAYAEEEGDATTLPYHDEIVEDQYKVRTYENCSIASIEEHFRAPSGCVLTLQADHDALTEVQEDIKAMPMFASETKISMVSLALYRQIGDTSMYSNSDTAWNVGIDDFASFIESKLPGLVLYEIEEKIADVELSARIEVQIYSSSSDPDGFSEYRLLFDVAPYRVEKYEIGDLLHLSATYYRDHDDVRATLRAEYSEDLFNATYGFQTDGRVEKDWDPGNYYEIYSVKYYDKDTNIILDIDDAYDTMPGIETTGIPSEPLTVFAVMTFVSGGIEYTFYSNEIVVQEPFQGIWIDGYNNRSSIGVNETHRLRLAENLDYGSIYSADFFLNVPGSDTPLVNRAYLDPSLASGDPGSLIGDDAAVSDVLDADFFTFDFLATESGDYVLEGQIMISAESFAYYNLSASFAVTVTDAPTSYTPLEEALTLNETGRIDCVAGGDPIDLKASIADDVLNDGDEPVFEWTTSRLNVVELSAEGGKATMNVIGGGVVTVTVTCTTKVFGSISKSIVVNVIDDIYSITSLDIPDEFHYSGKDLTVGLQIEKYAHVANLKPTWAVFNKAGEAVEFVDNGDCSITLKAPAQDDYTVSASYNGVELDSKVIEVRTVNTDEFVKQNIVWIALVTLLFVGAMVFLKVVLDRKGTLSAKINKTVSQFEAVEKDSASVVKDLNKIRLSILGDIDYARSLNMTALNEYEKTIRYLGKSMADIKDITKNKPTMTPEQYNEAYEKLRKDLTKARNVAKEIEDAKAQSLSNSLQANENNIARISDDKPKKGK